MPHIKHFQNLADIRSNYNMLLRLETYQEDMQSEDPAKFARLCSYEVDKLRFDTGLSPEQAFAQARQENAVFEYLLSVQNNLALGETDNVRPDADYAIHVFQVWIDRLLDITGAPSEAQLAKHPLFKKQYAACKHYRFQFSLPGWVNKMPATVPAFATKHRPNDPESEDLLEIPKP